MKKALLITGLITASTFASMAQNEYVKQYFYTAGGNYLASKNKVKVSVLKESKIKVIDSVYGDFSNFVDIFYDKPNMRYIGTAHVGRASGRDLLVRYDLDTYERIDSITATNAQAVAQNADRLLVAKAFINNSVYVDIYNAKTGKFITEVYGIDHNTRDIKIFGDSAFVAHSLPKKSNPYADSLGYVSIVKISTGMLSNTVNAGPKAAGIDNLIIRKEMDNRLHIYFGSDQDSLVKEVDNLAIHSLKKSVVVEVDDENIYSFDNSDTLVSLAKRSKDNLKNDTTATKIVTHKYANAFYFDRVNKYFLALVSDFASSSYLNSFSMDNGKPLSIIDLGTSATALQPDYRPKVATALLSDSEKSSVSVFPNPFKAQFTIRNSSNEFQSWELTNSEGISSASGDLNLIEESISADHLSKGLYLLTLKGHNTQRTVKIVKQ